MTKRKKLKPGMKNLYKRRNDYKVFELTKRKTRKILKKGDYYACKRFAKRKKNKNPNKRYFIATPYGNFYEIVEGVYKDWVIQPMLARRNFSEIRKVR